MCPMGSSDNSLLGNFVLLNIQLGRCTIPSPNFRPDKIHFESYKTLQNQLRVASDRIGKIVINTSWDKAFWLLQLILY